MKTRNEKRPTFILNDNICWIKYISSIRSIFLAPSLHSLTTWNYMIILSQIVSQLLSQILSQIVSQIVSKIVLIVEYLTPQQQMTYLMNSSVSSICIVKFIAAGFTVATYGLKHNKRSQVNLKEMSRNLTLDFVQILPTIHKKMANLVSCNAWWECAV